jgi:hypothetical protein
LVALLLVAMKVVPAFPGHFSRPEWIALALWLGIGAGLHLFGKRSAAAQESAHV